MKNIYIGDNMKSKIGFLIDERGYKKKYIAEKMGVSQTQLSNWINNRNYVPMDKAFKLSDLLKCKVDFYMRDRGKKMKINKIRRILYFAAKILGDVNAVKRGTAGKRVARRAAGKATGRLMGKLFK